MVKYIKLKLVNTDVRYEEFCRVMSLLCKVNNPEYEFVVEADVRVTGIASAHTWSVN